MNAALDGFARLLRARASALAACLLAMIAALLVAAMCRFALRPKQIALGALLAFALFRFARTWTLAAITRPEESLMQTLDRAARSIRALSTLAFTKAILTLTLSTAALTVVLTVHLSSHAKMAAAALTLVGATSALSRSAFSAARLFAVSERDALTSLDESLAMVRHYPRAMLRVSGTLLRAPLWVIAVALAIRAVVADSFTATTGFGLSAFAIALFLVTWRDATQCAQMESTAAE